MTSDQLKHAIGTLASRQSTEQVLNELKETGFPMNKISVIAKDTDHREQLSGPDTGERIITRAEGAKAGAVEGGRMGGSLALVGGLMTLLIPGIGPVLSAESALVTLLGVGASATAGGLVGALRGWFIPEEQAKLYDERVAQGDYLIRIEATENEIYRAEAVLRHRGIQEWRIYNASGNDAGH